jgi:hypothetical protein
MSTGYVCTVGRVFSNRELTRDDGGRLHGTPVTNLEHDAPRRSDGDRLANTTKDAGSIRHRRDRKHDRQRRVGAKRRLAFLQRPDANFLGRLARGVLLLIEPILIVLLIPRLIDGWRLGPLLTRTSRQRNGQHATHRKPDRHRHPHGT